MKNSWIPDQSEHDPRLYFDMITKVAALAKSRAGKMRVTAFADFIEEQSYGEESQSAWRRDVAAWLSGERTVSADKLRKLTRVMKGSFIRALFEVGYIQHLVVLIGKLLKANQHRSAAIVAAYTFRTWTQSDQFLTLDLLSSGGIFERDLPLIEGSLAFWETIPPRVQIEDVSGDALRCVFRLCDPTDSIFLANGAMGYPSSSAQLAAAFLLRSIFPKESNPFDPECLRKLMRSGSSLSKRTPKKGAQHARSTRKK